MDNFSILIFVFVWIVSVSGQCTEDDKPLVIDAAVQPFYLTSPNYPDNYPNDANCEWLIVAPTEFQKVIINIEDVVVEGIDDQCAYDYLVVYDGESSTSTVLAQLCQTNADSVNALVSTSDKLLVQFVSDISVAYAGWRIAIFTNDTANQPECSTSITATTTRQYVMSWNLPDKYTTDRDCLLRLYANTRAVEIMLHFLDQQWTAGCDQDALRISTVESEMTNTDLVLYTGCSNASVYNFTPPFPLLSAGLYTEISFTSTTDSGYLGYLLSYIDIFKGIDLLVPIDGDTLVLSLTEDSETGIIDNNLAVIKYTSTGTPSLTMDVTYRLTSPEPEVSSDRAPDFSYMDTVTDDLHTVRLVQTSKLDAELIDHYSIIVSLVDSDFPRLTFTLTFNITVIDVDDEAPVFLNLPNTTTITRSLVAGQPIYTVSSIDHDVSPRHSTVSYILADQPHDTVFTIDESSGVISLSADSNTIPKVTTRFELTIQAYSGYLTGGSVTMATLTVHVLADSPPECTNSEVRTHSLDSEMSGPGVTVEYYDDWNCTDDHNTVVYSIYKVVPVLESLLFTVDATSGVLSLLRRFVSSEFPNQLLLIQLLATDSIGQYQSINVSITVKGLNCQPNPRQLVVSMDQANVFTVPGELLVDGLNCSRQHGLTYHLRQYPPNTFILSTSSEGTAQLFLNEHVYKNQFYLIRLEIVDGTEQTELVYTVLIQTRSCDVP